MGEEYTKEQYLKLGYLLQAIHNLEGIPIPFNIIQDNIGPLQNWLKSLNIPTQ